MTLLEEVRKLLGDAVIDAHEHCGDATVLLERASLHAALLTLRDDPLLRFNMLVDLTAVDYLGREPRFEVVYHLASLPVLPGSATPARLRGRLRVKVGVPEAECRVASCVDVWAAGVVLHDLQPECASPEHERDDGHDADRDQGALQVNALFERLVLDAHASHSAAPTCAPRSARTRP